MVPITIDISRPFAGVVRILASSVPGSGRIRVFSGNPDSELLADFTQSAQDGVIISVVDTGRARESAGHS
ncbi:hypothetical protein ABZ434_32295 [Streptomyces sp. NPDC005761]|uniref:hypothetical protein n=1 Tax=unclassified Streptomyces TaxID=2593676 RepID=UPI0033E106BE